MNRVEYSLIKEVTNDWTQLPDSQRDCCNLLLTQMLRIFISTLSPIRSTFTSVYLEKESFTRQFQPTNTSSC